MSKISKNADTLRIRDIMPYGFEDTSFQAAGGVEGIARWINTFFALIEALPEDNILLQSTTSEDRAKSKRRLNRFLSGWLGGPSKYNRSIYDLRIPAMNIIHSMTMEEKDTWLSCMLKACTKQPYSSKFKHYLLAEIEGLAEQMYEAMQER
ncbi:MAG: hypothetical protein COA42_03255 [Alteromonadaceae bacterium]|nr:MAG: hypothetical protein COA42_03255 [Alteromonadaceae bacterium]